MSIQFITNENQVLSEVINNVLPSTKSWYVLVGYFYFSGFEEIYKNIADKEVKILVGMDVDIDPANKIREYQIINDINITRGEIRQNYYESLIKIINETPIFDSEKTQEAFKIFLAKIVRC